MKTIKIFFSLILFLSLYACSVNTENSENKAENKDSLIFLKETDTVFKTPESVKYDVKNNIFYISNINGKPTEKDGNGFISKMTSDGKNIELKWITGINAPKGMGIFGDKLYVTDIDELIEISIPVGNIIRKYPAKDAQFLNDIDIDKEGNVYVSDMVTGKIWILHNNIFTIWLQSDDIISPNGLYCENNNLLIGTKTKILSVNLIRKKINTLIENTGNIDGLELARNNNYLFSDWSGHVYIAKAGGKKKLLLNTADQKINAADIEFIRDKQLLLIPTFYHHTVSFYKLVK